MYQNEKEEAKSLQGARKPRKDEEMALAPPRNRSDWPAWEEARMLSDVDVEAKLSRRRREMLNEDEEN